MNEAKRGFDDMHSLNLAGFTAVCGLLNILIAQNEAGRPLSEAEKQEAAQKGDDYLWSIIDSNPEFLFNGD